MDEEIHGGKYAHASPLTGFMSCEMNQGYLTHSSTPGAFFSSFYSFDSGGVLGIDKS